MVTDIALLAIDTSSIVDIIIPVYRGLTETRRCLESVLAFPQRTACEIVVVNDCSPEPELSAWLRELAETGAITLLENPVNTGFVNAVNRGMILHLDRDVVLLNSDTEVHGDWLDRLRRCAGSDPMTGAVTPFSNNATICSYPCFNQDNPLPEDWPLAALDRIFAEVNAGLAIELPTAVGFCMYIRRMARKMNFACGRWRLGSSTYCVPMCLSITRAAYLLVQRLKRYAPKRSGASWNGTRII